MKTFPLKIWMIGILLILASACSKQKPIHIAVSKASPNYIQWLQSADSNITITNLYPLTIDSILLVLKQCDGLLLTGGEDIYPAYYRREIDTIFCDQFDRRRDSLEMFAFRIALNHKMPIFGICRGLQLINIALGGVLYTDIPLQYDTTVLHRIKEYTKCFHPLTIDTLSELYKVIRMKEGIVNSNHHQGILKAAPELSISAFANDGFPEAIEWKNKTDKSFLMAVQWHPERLHESEAFSKPLVKEFIHQSKLYKSKR